MDSDGLIVGVDALRSCASPWRGPLAFVALDGLGDWPEEPVLPACPVVGLGDPGHPFASRLDCTIEAPASAEGLARSVLANPLAAATTVQLLRILPGLPADQGLIAESMAYAMLQGSGEHRAWLASRRPASAPPGDPGKVGLSRSAEVLEIVLERPESGNAIDRAMRDALHEAFSLAALDPEVARVVLRGAGRTFSLGAELGEFGTTTDPAQAHAIRMQTLPAHPASRCADRLEVHVRGGCVGAGLELAAWARRFTAAPDAWFQLPELAMGILPGAGGCVSLTRRIGRQRTALMILSGKRISARTALGWGLVDAIAGDDGGADVG